VKEDSLSFGTEQRKAAVCNGLHHGKSFFFGGGNTSGCQHLLNKCVFSSAYRVTLISASQSHYDQYEMEIVQVIKEGTSTTLLKGTYYALFTKFGF